MAKELGLALGIDGLTVYARVIRGSDKAVWTGSVFETFNAAHWTSYALAATEESTDGIYYATMPATISTAGLYNVLFYKRAGGSAAITDAILGGGTIAWSGTAEILPTADPWSTAEPGSYAAGTFGSLTVSALSRLLTSPVVIYNALASTGTTYKITIVRNTDNNASEGLQIDIPALSGCDISQNGTTFALNIDDGVLSVAGSYYTAGGIQYGRFQPTAAQTKLLQAKRLHSYAAIAVLSSGQGSRRVAFGGPASYGVVDVIDGQDGA